MSACIGVCVLACIGVCVLACICIRVLACVSVWNETVCNVCAVHVSGSTWHVSCIAAVVCHIHCTSVRDAVRDAVRVNVDQRGPISSPSRARDSHTSFAWHHPGWSC